MAQIWVANHRFINIVISPFTFIFRSCSSLFTHYIYHIVIKKPKNEIFIHGFVNGIGEFIES